MIDGAKARANSEPLNEPLLNQQLNLFKSWSRAYFSTAEGSVLTTRLQLGFSKDKVRNQ